MVVSNPMSTICVPPSQARGWSGWDIALLSWLALLPFLAGFIIQEPALTIALAIAAAVMLHVVVVRRGGWRLIGPHCYYDLIRMARKGRTVLFRVLFLLALLVGIWYTYQNHPPGRPLVGDRARPTKLRIDGDGLMVERPNLAELRNRLARFNADCVYVWFFVQNLAILLLTPAYVGGAIAEERERRTLDLLFATALRDREIVLGKLAARMLHLGAFLLAGLPVFSMMLVWGGVDVTFLIAQWLHSALLLLAISSACLMFSTMPVRPTTCVITSYAVVLPAGLCCSGIWMEALQEAFLGGDGLASPHLLIFFCATYGLVIPACIVLAIQALRPRDWPPLAIYGVPPMLPLSAVSAALDTDPWRPALPPVSDDGLLWKECHTGGRSIWYSPELLVFGGMIVGTVVLVLVYATVMQIVDAQTHTLELHLRRTESIWGGVLRVTYAACLCCVVVGVAFRSAVCVVREHQMQTLDMLLMMPVDRRAILFRKYFGAVYKGWPWLALLGVNLAFGTLIGAYHPYGVLYLLFAPTLLVGCLAAVGLCISVMVRTPLQANLIMAGVLASLTISAGFTRPGLVLGYSSLTSSVWNPSPIAFEELQLACIGAGLLILMGTGAWCAATLLFNRCGRS
jgi:ABC-type transport system involved in multi-copper enzyme maturation permease subunit